MGVSTSKTIEGHPLAVRVFALVRDRSDADRRLVFLAVEKRTEHPGPAYVEALAACAREIGVRQPTSREYEQWRRTSASGSVAPSVGQVRTTAGSWSAAVAALPGVPSVDPTRRRLTARGRNFTHEEALGALRAFAVDVPLQERTQRRYMEWAATRLSERPGQAQRLPADPGAFVRLFGGWGSALDAAGALGEGRRAAPRLVLRVARFTREEMLEALRRAFSEIGEPFSRARYDGWASSVNATGSRTMIVPTAQTITRGIGGGWAAAVRAALGDRPARAGEQRGRRFTDGELLVAARECRDQLGHVPSEREYDTWRLGRAQETGYTDWPPSSASIRLRLAAGRWGAAMRLLDEDGTR